MLTISRSPYNYEWTKWPNTELDHLIIYPSTAYTTRGSSQGFFPAYRIYQGLNLVFFAWRSYDSTLVTVAEFHDSNDIRITKEKSFLFETWFEAPQILRPANLKALHRTVCPITYPAILPLDLSTIPYCILTMDRQKGPCGWIVQHSGRHWGTT